jgi:hypothetical protein
LKIKIGDADLLTEASLVIPEGKDAWVDFQVDDWNVRVHILVSNNVMENGKKRNSGVKMVGHDDHAELEFVNWDYPIDMTIDKPVGIATHKGRRISCLIDGRAPSPKMRSVRIFFLWEAAANG